MSVVPVRFGPLRFLLLLILVLAGGLAWMWFDQYGQLRNLAWTAPKALPPDIKVPADPSRAGVAAGDALLFAAILERPLFAPDRRPPPPPPPPIPPPPPDPLANIQIQGIFSGANAGILVRVEGKTRRVKINETIGQWTLKSIDGRDITFGQGDEKRQLRLAYARLNAPIPQPVVANAPPLAPAAMPMPAPMPGAVNPTQQAQDEVRERLQRRNQLRASRGLPPLTE